MKIQCQKMVDKIADLVPLTPNLYNAFLSLDREEFVPISSKAYELNAHSLGNDQWISSPLTVAIMTTALECENCDNILEIGCGSGYQAAILSKLAYRVFSVERIANLANLAKKRMKKLGILNVNIRHDDGNLGWKSFAPYDRILLSCATQEVNQNLFLQLKEGGILVAPVLNGDKQFIYRYKKIDGNLQKEILEECEFVPLLNGIE